MRLKTAVALLAVCGAVSPAQAEEPTQGGTLDIQWTRPNVLNADACDSTSDLVPITLTNTRAIPTFETTGTLGAWWVDSGNCADIKDATDPAWIGGLDLDSSVDSSAPLLTGTPLKFPGDLDDGTGQAPSFNIHDILAHKNACADAVAYSIFTLCIAVNYDDQSPDGLDGTKVDANEPLAWIEFDLDTMAPPKPEAPTIVALDESLQISVRVDTDPGDIKKWQVLYREKPTDPALAGLPCDTWTTDVFDAFGDGSGSATVDVSGKNLQPYEVCAIAIDDFDNESPPSDVVTGTPVPSTDFAEGYPEPIESGYGCTAIAPALPLVLVVPLLRRRQRSR